MLSQRYRIAVRRHLGVPFAGTAQAGRLFGWRFSIKVEDLEWKMSNLQPNEEQLLTGFAVASWQILGFQTVGNVLTATVLDAAGTLHTVNYTVQLSDLNPPPDIINPPNATASYGVALSLAAAINAQLNALGFKASASSPNDVPAPPFQSPGFAEVTLSGPSSALFTIGASATGGTDFIVGEQCYPSPITQTINNVQLFGYVPVLDALQNRVSSADLTLWIQTVDVVTFRKDEVRQRIGLYRVLCEMLSRDLGGKEYVDQFGGGSGGGATV